MRAMAAPMPLDAPVTRATLPLRSRLSVPMVCSCVAGDPGSFPARAHTRKPHNGYPPAMPTREKIEAYLSEPRNVIVAGTRKDGRPHATPHWFYRDGAGFYRCT